MCRVSETCGPCVPITSTRPLVGGVENVTDSVVPIAGESDARCGSATPVPAPSMDVAASAVPGFGSNPTRPHAAPRIAAAINTGFARGTPADDDRVVSWGMRYARASVALCCVLAASARAERITVGPVSIEAPQGFRTDGMRLVADGGVWAFSAAADVADLDAWAAAAWKQIAASFKDVQTVPATKQTLPSGFVIVVQGATAGDAAGHDHYLVFYVAYRPDTHRAYPSLLDAASDARYRVLGPIAGKSLSTIAVASAPSKPAEAAKPAEPAPAAATLRDGKYGCQTIGYGIGGPATLASAIGNIVLAKGTYESLGYKKSGKVRINGDRIAFSGGPFDGWVAQIATSTDSVYFRFSGKDRKEPGTKSQTGDDLCYLMK